MAVRETLRRLYGVEDLMLSDKDPRGSTTHSGVRYVLSPTRYKPMVVIRLDNKGRASLAEEGLNERSFVGSYFYGINQVIEDDKEPVVTRADVRIFSFNMPVMDNMPIIDNGINAN